MDKVDLNTRLGAVGSELDWMSSGNMELIGRLVIMSVHFETDNSSKNTFAVQSDNLYGMKAELEMGWHYQLAEGSMRPYATMGYRLDRGGVQDSRALEYGAGLQVHKQDFILDGLIRTQADGDQGDFDRDSISLSFSYDRGGDSRGLMLKLSQDYGYAELDPFAPVGQGMGYGSVDDQVSLETGYGLTLEPSGMASGGSATRLELLLTRKHGAADDIDSILLKLKRDL